MKNVVVFLFTYRLELLCDIEKTLRLARPAAATVSTMSGHVCSAGACSVGGSSAARPPFAGTTSGRLHGLRTRVGAASSSSSLSSTTQRSRRRFGARVLEARSMSPICKTKVIRCQRKGMTVYKNASWVKSFFTLGAGRPNL